MRPAAETENFHRHHLQQRSFIVLLDTLSGSEQETSYCRAKTIKKFPSTHTFLSALPIRLGLFNVHLPVVAVHPPRSLSVLIAQHSFRHCFHAIAHFCAVLSSTIYLPPSTTLALPPSVTPSSSTARTLIVSPFRISSSSGLNPPRSDRRIPSYITALDDEVATQNAWSCACAIRFRMASSICAISFSDS